jgi:Spy/CpxP family protein refolding chaperone
MGKRGFPGKGPEGKRGKFGDAKGAKFVEHKVGKLCAEIECSDDQRKKITAIVGQAKADRPDADMPERERVLADAMRAETFDGAAVSKQLEANEAAHEARHGAKHDAAVAIHGVLTPDQRDVIADRIEDEGPGALLGHHGKHRRGPK